MNITESQLDAWVRDNPRDAQGVVVELVWRLVAASCPRPIERRFPLGDSIGQHGSDGDLTVATGFDPFIPEGRSFWEVGTGLDAARKATRDYEDMVSSVPADERITSSFVFVTPLSGLRGWQHTWDSNGKAAWLKTRRDAKDWREVRVLDATSLVDWLKHFPAVEAWLAARMRTPAPDEFSSPEWHWKVIRAIGEPPPLTPSVFTAAREEAKRAFEAVLSDARGKLRLDTHYPDQCIDFLCACIESLDEQARADALGRCLIVSTQAGWQACTRLADSHILIADPALDLGGPSGTKLIQVARNAGHSVIYTGQPGGIPDPTRVLLITPRDHQLQHALQASGYPEERARMIATKSGGNLASLLRCLQNLSSLPDWATHSSAADLAIAQFLGGWNDSSEADRLIVERFSGKAYGEWTATMRALALRPGTPLFHKDGVWSCGSRYEAWHALGRFVFDEQLERFHTAALAVFQEDDPQFELPSTQRFAADIYGKSLRHSQYLRDGLADTLALLGSHPSALSSCSSGKAESTASKTVRRLLSGADWKRWASMNDVLPLFGEAVPGAFLDAVDEALASNDKPIVGVFAQEGTGFGSRIYTTGLLWALETIAWDHEYLGRATLCLGELAASDPGGSWGNRPSASLSMIFLPWHPQTCATIQQRLAAMTALLRDVPQAAWPLLIDMLPGEHTASHGTRKPVWRATIPDDWNSGVSNADYVAQSVAYSEVLVDAAAREPRSALQLVNHVASLPRAAFVRLTDVLKSASIAALPPSFRAELWASLISTTTKHRKYRSAEWALPAEAVDLLEETAEALAPTDPGLLYARLFTERELELFDENGDYTAQQERLYAQRVGAVERIAEGRTLDHLIRFAATVQSAWQVGYATGSSSSLSFDDDVVSALAHEKAATHRDFDRGYIWGRFRRMGWEWVSRLSPAGMPEQVAARLFAYLPFEPSTWDRLEQLGETIQREYWSFVFVRPFGDRDDLVRAATRLLEHERPYSALACLSTLTRKDKAPDSSLVIDALLAAVVSSEPASGVDSHEVGELIKLLQGDPTVPLERMIQVEWAYLPLLDRHSSASPVHLGAHLAENPQFFCEVLRVVYRSSSSPADASVPAMDEKIVRNAYALLSDWSVPPGNLPEGAYDGAQLLSWLDVVRSECASSGHLEIAMTFLGHVLTFVPPDPGGLWIHAAAARALDDKSGAAMRDGYVNQLYNSRGAHSVDPSGAEEVALAQQYRAKAAAADAAGFPRLAGSMRGLASMYDSEAVRVRDHFLLR